MKQLTRDKLLYWLRAIDEDCTKARNALTYDVNPNKQLQELVIPIKDSTRNLIGIIKTEL